MANPWTPAQRQQFSIDLLSSLGDPLTPANEQDIVAWEAAENTAAANNPLATTLGSAASGVTIPGSTSFNGSGVQNYPSYGVGVAATAATLKENPYAKIVAALQQGIDTPAQLSQLISASPWGTEPFGGASSSEATANEGTTALGQTTPTATTQAQFTSATTGATGILGDLNSLLNPTSSGFSLFGITVPGSTVLTEPVQAAELIAFRGLFALMSLGIMGLGLFLIFRKQAEQATGGIVGAIAGAELGPAGIVAGGLGGIGAVDKLQAGKRTSQNERRLAQQQQDAQDRNARAVTAQNRAQLNAAREQERQAAVSARHRERTDQGERRLTLAEAQEQRRNPSFTP